MTFSVSDSEPMPDKSSEDIDWMEVALDHLDMSREELEEAVAEKKVEYSGLVSQDDAAAILVCRDHDIEVVDEVREDPRNINFELENLVPGMSDVDVRCRVVSVDDINQFDGGQVRSIIVKDSSASTQVSFWDEDADHAGKLSSGDDIVIKSAYTKREIGDYMQDRFGLPAIQIGDDASVELVEGDEVI